MGFESEASRKISFTFYADVREIRGDDRGWRKGTVKVARFVDRERNQACK